MILLDTNVVSEPMRPKPDRNVLGWLDAQPAESLYLSTVSLAELLLGIESLPAGKRRKALAAALDEQIIALFGERIMAFDIRAAETYARVVMRARRHGHPIAVADAQIARRLPYPVSSAWRRGTCRHSRPPASRSSTPGPRRPRPEPDGRRRSGPQPWWWETTPNSFAKFLPAFSVCDNLRYHVP